MSNKWLQREGQTWVDKQIITRDQYEEILKLYPTSTRRITQILPILASILIGLGLLTFVASNWDGMPEMLRLTILMLTIVGFYLSGFSLYKKGHSWLGQGLLGLGVISFGAGMILIGQMFHLVAYDARVFVLWSLASLVLLYLYRETLFFLLSAILLFAGQVYALTSFSQSSWTLLALVIIGLGGFAYRSKNPLISWIMAFLLGSETLMILIGEDAAMSWVAIIPFALYVFGLWMGNRPISQGFLLLPQVFGFAFSALMVFLHGYVHEEAAFLADNFHFMILFSVLLILSLWKIGREKEKWIPLILFMPLFYLPEGDIAYLAVMFVYASSLIFYGDQADDRWKSNWGVFLFMLSSFFGYIQLAWDFLDKSLFFLIGGMMLFAIHWALRKRSRWLPKGEE